MNDKIDELKKLKQLLDEGLIDNLEFEKLKAELLSKTIADEGKVVEKKPITNQVDKEVVLKSKKTTISHDKRPKKNRKKKWLLFAVLGGLLVAIFFVIQAVENKKQEDRRTAHEKHAILYSLSTDFFDYNAEFANPVNLIEKRNSLSELIRLCKINLNGPLKDTLHFELLLAMYMKENHIYAENDPSENEKDFCSFFEKQHLNYEVVVDTVSSCVITELINYPEYTKSELKFVRKFLAKKNTLETITYNCFDQTFESYKLLDGPLKIYFQHNNKLFLDGYISSGVISNPGFQLANGKWHATLDSLNYYYLTGIPKSKIIKIHSYPSKYSCSMFECDGEHTLPPFLVSDIEDGGILEIETYNEKGDRLSKGCSYFGRFVENDSIRYSIFGRRIEKKINPNFKKYFTNGNPYKIPKGHYEELKKSYPFASVVFNGEAYIIGVNDVFNIRGNDQELFYLGELMVGHTVKGSSSSGTCARCGGRGTIQDPYHSSGYKICAWCGGSGIQKFESEPTKQFRIFNCLIHMHHGIDYPLSVVNLDGGSSYFLDHESDAGYEASGYDKVNINSLISLIQDAIDSTVSLSRAALSGDASIVNKTSENIEPSIIVSEIVIHENDDIDLQSVQIDKLNQKILNSRLTENDEIVEFPDVEAEFPGGDAVMMKWINANVVYPQTSIEMNEQGRVFVSFVVEKNGKVSNVVVERGVSTDLDKEAKRVVRKMPKWTAGETTGRKVRTRCRLPINFQLN